MAKEHRWVRVVLSLLATVVAGSLLGAVAAEQAAEPATTPEVEVPSLGSMQELQAAIRSHDLLLVAFVREKCVQCRKAEQLLQGTAELLGTKLGIHLATADLDSDAEFRDKYRITGVPTVLLFRGDEFVPYSGGRSPPEMASWLRRKSGVDVATVDTTSSARDLIRKHQVLVIGCFESEESREARAFLKAAVHYDSFKAVQFTVSTDPAVAASFKMQAPAIKLFRKSELRSASYAPAPNTPFASPEAITEFVRANQLNPVTFFSQETAKLLFNPRIPNHLLLFTAGEAEECVLLLGPAEAAPSHVLTGVPVTSTNQAVAGLQEVARENLGRFTAVVVDKVHTAMWRHFGAHPVEAPVVMMIHSPADDDLPIRRYAMDIDEQVGAATLREFVDRYLRGDVASEIVSEEEPAVVDANVVPVTAETFETLVLDDSRDVLLEFYAPFASAYGEVARRLAPIDTVAVMKIDATANDVDHPSVAVRGYPTLKLYRAVKPGQRRKPVVEYKGPREVDEILTFVRSRAVYHFKPSQVLPAKEEEGEDWEEGAEDDEADDTDGDEPEL